MNETYRVTLTESQRVALGRRIAAGTSPARDLTHARILRKADEGQRGGAVTDAAISTLLDVSTSTIERVRKRFVEQGLDAAIRRRTPPSIDG
jgi:hypothetical protein